ncbi:MAG: hypothetical protein U5N27_09775 [Rhizobium sp.]|nr:hypothetical protein [Rhizobium sp.]
MEGEMVGAEVDGGGEGGSGRSEEENEKKIEGGTWRRGLKKKAVISNKVIRAMGEGGVGGRGTPSAEGEGVNQGGHFGESCGLRERGRWGGEGARRTTEGRKMGHETVVGGVRGPKVKRERGERIVRIGAGERGGTVGVEVGEGGKGAMGKGGEEVQGVGGGRLVVWSLGGGGEDGGGAGGGGNIGKV